MYIDFYEVLSEVFKLIFFIYKVNKMRIKFVRILWNFVWYLKYFVKCRYNSFNSFFYFIFCLNIFIYM